MRQAVNDDILNLAAYYSAQQPKTASGQGCCAGRRRPEDLQGRQCRQRRAGLRVLSRSGRRRHPGAVPAPGQPACKYVELQLKHFRSGDRANDGGKMMQVIARKMTDQEMKAVAEYISGLR
jgi:cytochrome c553